MKRVYAKDPRDFEFTKGQREKLLLALTRGKRKSQGKLAHIEMLRQARIWTGIWLEFLAGKIYYDEMSDTYRLSDCTLPPRNKVFRSCMSEMAEATLTLKSLIKNLPPAVSTPLSFHLADYSQDYSPDYLRDVVLDYRNVDKKLIHLLDSPTMLILDLLTLLEKSCHLVIENHQDEGGTQSPILRHLLTVLAYRYEIIYEKKAAYSKNTQFVDFMTAIAEIFSLTISPGLIKNQFQKYYVTE